MSPEHAGAALAPGATFLYNINANGNVILTVR
jgi:hypothetical protein